MDVILQLNTEAANILQFESLPDSKLVALSDVLVKHGVAIRPQHPNIDDDELSRFFIVQLIDGDVGVFLEDLRSIDYVTAVYEKQKAELP